MELILSPEGRFMHLLASRVTIGNANNECSVAKVGHNELHVSSSELEFNHFVCKT